MTIDRNISDFAAGGVQFLARIQHSVVLDGRRDNVIAWLCQTEDGKVISFGAAAGEYNFRSATAQKIRNRFARPLHGGPPFLPMMMDGRRVSEMLAEVGPHGLENFGEDGGAGVIVEIDSTH